MNYEIYLISVLQSSRYFSSMIQQASNYGGTKPGSAQEKRKTTTRLLADLSMHGF